MTVGGRKKMKKDRIFQETLQEKNQRQKTVIARILKCKFKKEEFKTVKILVGDQLFTIDLMSNDDKIAVKIINPRRTSHEKISPGKFQHIFAICIILRAIDSERKLLIFTNKMMYQKFYRIIKTMPSLIRDTIQGIEIAWIPFDNDEYSEPRTNFRSNEGSLNQIGRTKNERN
jgi:hypothetical protein|tara:strand:+ start:1210 stop:1728 length:519 start_codon:yes stop_codon:yes gene_type:complete